MLWSDTIIEVGTTYPCHAGGVSSHYVAIKPRHYPGLVSFVGGVLVRINSGLQDAQSVCSVPYLSDVNGSHVFGLEIVVAL